MPGGPVFKHLTEEDKGYLASVYRLDISHEERVSILSKRFSVSARSIRRWWLKMGLTPTPERLPLQLEKAWQRDLTENADILLVSSVQNQSVVHQGLLDGMRKYAQYIEENFKLKVQIVVIPTRYRNPTTPMEDEKSANDLWWDASVDEYLHYNEVKFGDTLIDAMARTVPTAKMPLTGHEPSANGQNYVIGHPRVHVKMMPRFKGERSYVLATTGALTYRNYSKSKAGDVAKIHHTYGFLAIEKRKDGTCYAPRAVKANDDGTFTDYKFHYDGKEVVEVGSCKAYIWGDVHHRELCEKKDAATRALMNDLEPENIILHDVFDGSTVNPHEKDDLFIRRLKVKQGLYVIEQEVNECLAFVAELDQSWPANLYVVQSNHDDFLDRHINNRDWKKDLHNSEGYLKYALIQQSIDLREHGNIFGYLISSNTNGKVKYIPSSQPLKIMGYQCGYHGDHGINGARASVNSFKNVNSKIIHGHGHSPQMIDGVTMVGVSCSLWQYYNSNGMSSWAYADSIIHHSGKNQLIIFDEFDLGFTNLTDARRKAS